MRFNPAAFKRQSAQAPQAPAPTDSIAATSIEDLPEENESQPESQSTPAAPPAPPRIIAAWRLNDQKKGVEIHFSRRPDDAALAPLRADRAWRYTGYSKCWYSRQSNETIEFAKAFCEKFNAGEPVAIPVVKPAEPISTPAPSAYRIIRVSDLMRPRISA